MNPTGPPWGSTSELALAAARHLGAFTGEAWTVLIVEHAYTGDTWPQAWHVQAADPATAEVVAAALHGGLADIIGVLPGQHELTPRPAQVTPTQQLRDANPELTAATRAVHAARVADTRATTTNVDALSGPTTGAHPLGQITTDAAYPGDSIQQAGAQR